LTFCFHLYRYEPICTYEESDVRTEQTIMCISEAFIP
jgi:hypothetical protein